MKQTSEYVRIMDIDFINTRKREFLDDKLLPAIERGEKRFVVTANPEIVMKARENVPYKLWVQSADYVVPDGYGIVLASKIKKQPLKERIPGFELTLDLLEYANEVGLSCYFLGATKSVNDRLVDVIKQDYPHIKIAGHHHGFIDMADEELAREIASQKADIVFVALGSPRQEEWIKRYDYLFSKGLFIGVGGSFDVLAGQAKRAPEFWIKLNLEWFYRLLMQPSRFGRILKVFQFIFLILIGRR